ncbi:hypothetical protein JOD07_001468 [Defluviitalea raffinosedens]|nr:hypothetical protein [Defluviitalea raffinosedens]
MKKKELSTLFKSKVDNMFAPAFSVPKFYTSIISYVKRAIHPNHYYKTA